MRTIGAFDIMKGTGVGWVLQFWRALPRAGRFAFWISCCLFELGGIVQAAPNEVYVDVAYRTNGAWVTFPNSGGTGRYCVGRDAFNSIQAGVSSVAVGGTVHVAAGLYVENVPLTKSLTMLGPNAGRPGDGPRLPEAIVVPAFNDPENSPIILVGASHIVIDGFLLDGNNPTPPFGFGKGYNANGIQVYAAAAVQNGIYPDMLEIDHITIRNNIIRNLSYDGIYLDRYPFFGTASGWNYVQNNKFENMWEGLLTYAVDAVIANNTITNVTHGLSVHGVCVAAPVGFNPQISSNILTIAQWWPLEINVVHAPGIWVNFRRGTASPLSVRANIINTPKAAPAGKVIRGIEVLTVDEQGKVNLIGNIINGFGNCQEGIYAAGCWRNEAVTVRGGALNNIKTAGIILRTTDPEWPPEWPPAVDTFLTISGTTIRMASDASGIAIWQQSTSPTNRAQAIVTANTMIHGAATAIRVQGPNAAATIRNNANLFGATAIGLEVDAGRALLEANDLTGCTIAALSAYNAAVIDAGDCAGRNLTGLGTGGNSGGSSLGLNDFSGYGFNAQKPWAITNSGAGAIVAHRNMFGALPSDDLTAAFCGEVEFSQFGGIIIQPPPSTTVKRLSELPPPLTTLADFIRAGGKASSSVGILSSTDSLEPNDAGGYTVTRAYTLRDSCGESGACQQIINVTETACTVSVSHSMQGGATLTVRGVQGAAYALLTTTNFLDWVSLRTNSAPFSWVDNFPAALPCRFYRAALIQ